MKKNKLNTFHHQHKWIRMATETIKNSLYEYLNCFCGDKRTKIDGKIQRQKKVKTEKK